MNDTSEKPPASGLQQLVVETRALVRASAAERARSELIRLDLRTAVSIARARRLVRTAQAPKAELPPV